MTALFARAMAESLIVVTNNRRDYLELAERVDLHAGLIILLPTVRRERKSSCSASPSPMRPPSRA